MVKEAVLNINNKPKIDIDDSIYKELESTMENFQNKYRGKRGNFLFKDKSRGYYTHRLKKNTTIVAQCFEMNQDGIDFYLVSIFNIVSEKCREESGFELKFSDFLKENTKTLACWVTLSDKNKTNKLETCECLYYFNVPGGMQRLLREYAKSAGKCGRDYVCSRNDVDCSSGEIIYKQ